MSPRDVVDAIFDTVATAPLAPEPTSLSQFKLPQGLRGANPRGRLHRVFPGFTPSSLLPRILEGGYGLREPEDSHADGEWPARPHQCSRGSRLALLESLPKPNKQQHAANRREEWDQTNHRPPPDSGILRPICSDCNGNESNER